VRAVIQRVKEAKVFVEGKVAGKIGQGMVILLGIGKDDREEDAKYLVDKVFSLRIFEGGTNLHPVRGLWPNGASEPEKTRIHANKEHACPPSVWRKSTRIKDGKKRMNLSLLDIKGGALVVSQFTLYGNTKRGRRPSFTQAAEPKKAKELYEKFINLLRKYNLKVASGVFGAKMLVEIQNDGPVTLILDSKKN